MRVLHVITGISRQSGGPSRSVQGLVAGLNAAGVETWLMTLNHGDEPWIEGMTQFVNGGVFEEVVQRIEPDIVHLHGIWSVALHRCAATCRRLGIKYVIAPRGMLEPWSLQQKWLKKRIARWLYQDQDLKCAAALHATAESEAEQFRKLGFKNPIIVSPNGVNVPKNFSRVERVERVEKKRVLFVSRMHPKKGVMELVEAWGKLVKVKVIGEGEDKVKVGGDGEERNQKVRGEDGWVCELVYTVSGDVEREYEARVKRHILELGMSYQDTDGTIHSSPSPLTLTSAPPAPNFIFTGALNDDAKWKAYARADLFVLPTYSENFGIVVAEALWAGVPVITTKGTPWVELDEHGCGWWVDVGVESITVALKEAMFLDDAQRREMGVCGRTLVEKKYTWDAVVKMMVKGYKMITEEC